eukprot:RCo048308
MEELGATHRRLSSSGSRTSKECDGKRTPSPSSTSPSFAAYDDCEVFPISLMKSRSWPGPMAVMTSTYLLCQWLGYVLQNHSGDIQASLSYMLRLEPGAMLQELWAGLLDVHALAFVMGFFLFQGLLLWVVPGPEFAGPRTANGYVPVYRTNGLACHLLTL